MNKVAAAVAAATVAAVTVAVVSTTGGSAAWQGSFNASYQAASPGDTIAVPAGSYAADWPSEGALKILPAAKATSDPVTFVCEGGDVNVTAGQMVITAQHVRLVGSCFKLKKLWVGDPANGVSTADVVVDGASMESFDISGSDDVTIKNATVGPSLAGPNNPRYYEPKVHNGGSTGSVVPRRILIDNVTFRDMQTVDPATYHTGCLWVGYGTTGSLTVRNSRFSGCAIYDIHVDTPASWNLTLDGNTFAAPVLPQSQGVGEVPASQPDVEVKCQNGQLLTNYTLTNNQWAHGWNLVYGGCTGATYSGLTVTGNTGGINRNPAETAAAPPPPTTAPTDTTVPAEDTRIVQARDLLKQQIAKWRRNQSWTWVKTQPAWAAYVILGGK